MDITITAKLPEQLLKQAQKLIDDGWISDIDSLITEALRRFIDSHQTEIIESFIKEDVQWGLYGKE